MSLKIKKKQLPSCGNTIIQRLNKGLLSQDSIFMRIYTIIFYIHLLKKENFPLASCITHPAGYFYGFYVLR